MSCSNQELIKNIQNYSFSTNNRIGRGFSSDVYRGHNTQTNVQVAIKVIDLRKLEKDSMHELLQSEIRITKNLMHQNIIKCENVFITVNNCYIVTELCGDGDLASAIKKRGRFRGMEALKTMLQIAKGFAYLSTINIIHRDIKPANILINNGTVKIADFGFAQEKIGWKKEKYSVGSPLYMSPEALNHNIYSKQGDIWSLGVVFYEILQGRPPWEPKNQKQLKEIFNTKPQIIFRVAVRDELQNMIKRCLAYERQSRITAHGIVQIIQDLMKEMNKNEGVSAYRQTLTRRPSYTNIETSSYSIQNTKHTIQTLSVNKQNGRCSTNKLQKKYSLISKKALPPRLVPNRSTKDLGLNSEHRVLDKKNVSSHSTHNIHSIHNLICKQETNQLSIEQASRYNHKILKSLINFARFVYKLFPRVRALSIKKWLLQRIQLEMAAILKFTIQTLHNQLKKDKPSQVCQSNILNMKMFEKFIETRCYSKTYLVVEEYLARYKSFIKKKEQEIISPQNSCKIPELNNFKDLSVSSQRIKEVLQLLNMDIELSLKNEQLLAVDFLVSLVILLDMLGSQTIDSFAQNSRIEQIVDTTPVSVLNGENIEELRMRVMMVLE